MLKAFKKYYRANTPILPDRFTRREFGFMFFDRNFVQRHLGFANQNELRKYMIGNVPAHSYYSTSYYRKPAAPTMDEKEWLGAELIFDLDADHLDGAKEMTYAEMLLQIRSEMINLVDSFLLGDLGFSEDQVHITFSGGRGYHAHVRTPDIMGLGTHERRELVDYITCSGMDIDWIFPIKRTATSRVSTAAGTVANVAQDRLIPPADSGGWKLRMRNGLKDTVQFIVENDLPEIKKEYPCLKGGKNALLDAAKKELAKNGTAMFEKDSMVMLSPSTQNILVKIMKEDVAHRLSGEVDEPVTADIKRLIRLPGSVHGKSGLRVTPITRQELTDFDPLQMAVPDVYSDEPVKITMRKDASLDMKGEHFTLSGETEVPEFAAVFLIGRKMADWGYLSEESGKEKLFRTGRSHVPASAV
jgi:DNA primase small subunit